MKSIDLPIPDGGYPGHPRISSGTFEHAGVTFHCTDSEWPRPQKQTRQLDLVPTMHLLVEANQYLATGIIPWRYHALGDPEAK